MKTAMQELKEEMKKIGYVGLNEFFEKHLETEKQQHEQTAIHITNVLMDALDNPKGGKFSVEYEFNKYWDKNYNS